jgi:hypothetical protein
MLDALFTDEKFNWGFLGLCELDYRFVHKPIDKIDGNALKSPF